MTRTEAREMTILIKRVRAEMAQDADRRPLCDDCHIRRVIDLDHIVCRPCQRQRMDG